MGAHFSHQQSPIAHKYVVDVLKRTPFMQLLDDQLISEIAHCFEVVKYACGAVIKTDSHQFFIVAEGTVDISSLIPTANAIGATINSKQQVTEFLCQRNAGDYICYTSREQLLTRLLLASADGHAHYTTKKKLMKLLDLNKTSADATLGCTLLKLHRERFTALRGRLATRRPNVKNTARFSGGKSKDRSSCALTAAEKLHLVKSIVESEVVSYLLDIPFLENVEESRLVTLSNLCSYMFVRRGDVLCHEGEIGDRFFICIRGSLQATVNVHMNAASQTYVTLATTTTATTAEDETRAASWIGMRPGAAADPARYSPVGTAKEKKLQTLKRMSTGSYFGEISLLFKIPRIASITALEDTLLVCIDRSTFCNFLKMAPEASLVLLEHVRMHFLDTLIKQGCAFLQAIPALKLQELSTVSELAEYQAGATIIHRGEKRTAFYILLRGEVQMEYDEEDDERAEEAAASSVEVSTFKTRRPEVVLVRPGGYFGQEALILHRRSGSSVQVKCTDQCLLLKLSRDAFDEFFTTLPEVYAEFCLKCLRDKAQPEHVMQHYDAHKLWAADCIVRRRHHDVALFEHIEDFKWDADFSDDHLHERALVIYMKFLAETAPCPVTISTQVAQAIEQELCAQSVGRDVFAATRTEILASMADEHFEAFKRSRAFHEFLASLHCPQSIFNALTPVLEERLSMTHRGGRGLLASKNVDEENGGGGDSVDDDEDETDEDLVARIASNRRPMWTRRSSATVFTVASALAAAGGSATRGRDGTLRDLGTLANNQSESVALGIAMNRRKMRAENGPRRLSSTFVF